MTTLPMDVEIEYEDAKGNPTRRFVTINSVSESGGKTYLNTWDHGRDDLRTFRADRVVCFITNDGEIVEPSVMLPQLRATAGPRAPRKRGSWWRAAFWILVVLAAMMAADIGFSEGDVALGLVAFVLLAAPLFFLRWVGRAITRSIGAGKPEG